MLKLTFSPYCLSRIALNWPAYLIFPLQIQRQHILQDILLCTIGFQEIQEPCMKPLKLSNYKDFVINIGIARLYC